MGQQSAGEPRRAPLYRFAGRAVVLAALGTGLWLAGQATATAEELMPPATAVETPSAAVDAVAAPSVELLARTTFAPAPAANRMPAPVAPVAGPATAAVAPVAPVPVAPVVSAAESAAKSAARSAVHSAVVPVTDIAAPTVQAAKPVLEVAPPLRDVAAPVVAAVGHVVPPVTEAVVALASAPDPLLGPVAGVLGPVAGVPDPLLGPGPIGTQERPDTDSHGLNGLVQGSPAGPAGAGRVMALDGDDVFLTAAAPGGAAGEPGPVRPHTPTTGGPVRTGVTGSHSFDQSPADLTAAVLATITAALAVTGDARDAAGNIASDPSFSPD